LRRNILANGWPHPPEVPPKTKFYKCFVLFDHDFRIPDDRHLGLRLLAAENWHASSMFFSDVVIRIPLFIARYFLAQLCAIEI
jgi:hypothetical protein